MISKINRKIKKYWLKTPMGRVRKNDNPVKWGVIGLGYMAEIFSTAIDGNKNGVVAAVASRSMDKANEFAKRHGGCKAYGSYESMVNDGGLNLDIIYIATPVKYHYQHIKLCLEARKNVLCEKPITFSVSQLEELIDLARENDCFLMEGMWMKCLPSYQKACEWINNGYIGDIEWIKVDFYKHELINEKYAIFNSNEGGGVMRDFGVYAIAFMEHFLGDYPNELRAFNRLSAHNIDADWQITASRNGIRASVNLSSNFGSLSKASVIGKKGYIEWNSPFNRTNKVSLYDSNGLLKESSSFNYEFEGFEYEVNEVQRVIREGGKESSIVPLSETHGTMQIIDYLLNSNLHE